jgi:rhodanese-related sulfurtransferase
MRSIEVKTALIALKLPDIAHNPGPNNGESPMKQFILAILVACSASIYGGEVPDISHEDLSKAVEAKTVVLIDANGSASYKSGHIPGAIDFEAEKAELATKLPKDKNALVVAYCGGPKCAAYKAAAEQAVALGYTNVKHYSKGIAGWKEAGAKVEGEAPKQN